MLFHKLFISWASDFWNVVDVGAIGSTYLLCVYTLSGPVVTSSEKYRIVAAIGSFFLWVRLLGYMKLLSLKLATFVLALFQIFADLQSFLVVLALIMGMFTCMFYLLGHPGKSDHVHEVYESPVETLLMLYGMMIGEYSVDEFRSSPFMMILNVGYMFIMTIVMLNILIAIVSDSYEAAMIRSKAMFVRAKFELAAELVAVREALGWKFSESGLRSDYSYTKLLSVNVDDTDDENEWMGRALDMEMRVRTIVEDANGQLLDEIRDMMSITQQRSQ